MRGLKKNEFTFLLNCLFQTLCEKFKVLVTLRQLPSLLTVVPLPMAGDVLAWAVDQFDMDKALDDVLERRGEFQNFPTLVVLPFFITRHLYPGGICLE